MSELKATAADIAAAEAYCGPMGDKTDYLAGVLAERARTAKQFDDDARELIRMGAQKPAGLSLQFAERIRKGPQS